MLAVHVTQVGDLFDVPVTVLVEYPGQKPVPVVVDLHGYSEGATVHRLMSGMATLGATAGFITVTPQGQGPVPRWDTALTGSPDVAFIGAMLDQVEAQHCVDLNRVYVLRKVLTSLLVDFERLSKPCQMFQYDIR